MLSVWRASIGPPQYITDITRLNRVLHLSLAGCPQLTPTTATQMIATEPIPKGCEVVNCYGQLSNAELLRGYGYVEAHNTLQHVQVPTHFCIKAAAAARADSTAAAGPAAGKGRKKQSEAAAAGQESGSEDDSPPSESEGAGSEESEESDEGEDDATSEGESSEASEPDWDLEDDSPKALRQQQQRQQQYWAQQQQQQQQPQQGAEEATEGRARKKPKRQQQQPKQQQEVRTIPSLAAAQQQIPDWEERWQLCFSLGLLPKNGVIQVPAGGFEQLPGAAACGAAAAVGRRHRLRCSGSCLCCC